MRTYEKVLLVLSATAAGLAVLGSARKPSSVYEDEPWERNPMEGKMVRFVYDEGMPKNADGVRGYLVVEGESSHKPTPYERYVKRVLDIALSFSGLIVLAPVLVAVGVAIAIDDPGPVLFTQKRVGRDKRYFKLHKFRSMKMSTPHDIPTHMLANPEHYVTRTGKFIRKHSLDELPQLWEIFLGNMSVVGPRPGLFNQDLLTAERDRWGANDIKPGLTGWAQINGRDELEIPEKARFDGEYAKNLGLMMDIRCFVGSLGVFAKGDGVVEGASMASEVVGESAEYV